MKTSRRDFIKIAGAATMTTCAGGATTVLASGGSADPLAYTTQKGKKALTARQWAMVIDTTHENYQKNLHHMMEACHKAHNVPVMPNKRHEIKWIWETEFKHAFPGQHSEFMSENVEEKPFMVLCNHCEAPPCVRACPTQATFKRPDGIVIMDMHRCIGCRFCMAACPYGSRSFNFLDPQPHINEAHMNKKFPRRMKGVVEKCNFCAERLAVGEMPYCVEASEGAVVFGDLYDPESAVRHKIAEKHAIRRKPQLGTGPAVYYIV
ncbi:4Fe-4S dicluster domain-containing protein [Desulfobacterales bacterium HSG17]|nr:4Fe-4S dicluster domain-containing protein [Desulfobacterales bacterium HSG17]